VGALMNQLTQTALAGLDEEDVLPPALADAFIALGKRVHARRRQMLIAQGSEASDVYLIETGRVNISVFSANGRETILREMGPGRLVGEMAAIDGRPRSANVTVTEDAVLVLVSAAAFKRFLIDVPGAGYWMAAQLVARVRNLSDKSVEFASQPVAARLVSELLRITAASTPGDDRCEIARLPTHADLAARIGTHREAVTRELRQLTREGMVAQTGRRLEIVSRSALTVLLERLSR
jgi:CRP/FNR family transcriptional regulator, cyclic AMP receptor protein